MFIIIPAIRQELIKLDPPKLINGKVIPVIGNMPVATPILIIT
jgi:hypothetical protein